MNIVVNWISHYFFMIQLFTLKFFHFSYTIFSDNKINLLTYNQLDYNNNATLNNSLSTGTNQEIIGRNYVSGSVGWTNGRIKKLKVENCQVTASGNYVGGAVGYNEYTNTSISTSNNSNYSTAGAYVSNVTIIGSGYVGGIAG